MTTHNAACWHECRVYAEQFLRQCAARVPAEPGEGFVQAAEEYKRVHTALDGVRALFPFDVDEALPSSQTIERTPTQLRKAREAEREGLVVLRQVSAWTLE